eukprot:TRINITY_DN13874_c1_g1_i2.p1 TRINITY_DN13874_c1_g1~~TRINITY_DN13874_c1_g1_i2.p1  ORF type:complete len:1396 (+),score=292.75 TRINITY_DN13874_c1_g1_i2:48-4190(+)
MEMMMQSDSVDEEEATPTTQPALEKDRVSEGKDSEIEKTVTELEPPAVETQSPFQESNEEPNPQASEVPDSVSDLAFPEYLRGDFRLFDANEDVEGFKDIKREINEIPDGTAIDPDDSNLFEDAIEIGEIKAEIIDMQVERISAGAYEEEQKRNELERLREEELNMLQRQARKVTLQETDRIDDEIYRMKARTREFELQARESITRLWRQSEDSLLTSTANSGGQLSKHLNICSEDTTNKRWIAEWERTPQPLLLTIHGIKGTKDRLMEGYYCLHVELVDVLGGNPISYVSKVVDECKANTRPHRYLGKFYEAELTFQETLRMVCPSSVLLRSHVVLQIELWLLKKGKYSPVDTNVAWAAWPLVDADFQIKFGRFKTPVLLGAIDKTMDTFEKMQDTFENDLSNWIGNLYFTIEPDMERILKPAKELSLAPRKAQMNSTGSYSGAGMTRTGSVAGMQTAVSGILKKKSMRRQGSRTSRRSQVSAELESKPWSLSASRLDEESTTLSVGRMNNLSPKLGKQKSLLRKKEHTDSESDSNNATVEVASPSFVSVPRSRSPRAGPRGGTRLAMGSPVIKPSFDVERKASDGSAASGNHPKRDSDASESGADYFQLQGVEMVQVQNSQARGSLVESVDEPEEQKSEAGSSANRLNNCSEAQLAADSVPAIESVRGPDRKVEVASDLEYERGDEVSMLGIQLLSKTSFFTDLVPGTTPLEGKQKINKNRAHYMQVVSKKSKDWELLDMISKEAEAPQISNEELNAGELEVEEDFAPVTVVETLADKPRASQLAQMANMLPVLKKIQRAGNVSSGVSSEDFFCSVSGRREFFKMRRHFREKLPFIQSVLFFDFGINPTGSWDKRKVVTAVFLFLLTAHIRTFTHGFGLWIFLTSRNVPLIDNIWLPHRVLITFDDGKDSTFTPMWEVLAVCSGQLFSIGVQMLLMFVSVAIQFIFGFFPYVVSRIVFWYSFAVLLDPLFTCLLDVMSFRWRHGEAFLLYHMFEREEGAGVPGLLLTLALYLKLTLITGTLFYKFTTCFHLNGRINDVYKRVKSPESSFFVPYDTEISQKEFDQIIYNTQNWRSESGDVKRVVCEEVDDFELCLFRERLLILLQLSKSKPGDDPNRWVQEYFNKITLTRPKRAKKRQKLGSARIGNDIRSHLKKHYPFLMETDDYLRAEKALDNYYDEDYRNMRDNTTVQDADRKEQKHLLLRYFEPQIIGYPVRVCEDLDAEESDTDSDCEAKLHQKHKEGDEELTIFKVMNIQLLADLIFFETSTSLLRNLRLRDHLGMTLRQGRPVRLPGFCISEPFKSCVVNPITAAFITIYITQPADRNATRQVFRSFVYMPNGAFIEANPGAAPFDPLIHTTDHPEYWSHRTLARHMGTAEE